MSVENDDEERKEKLNEAKDEDVVIEKKKKGKIYSESKNPENDHKRKGGKEKFIRKRNM